MTAPARVRGEVGERRREQTAIDFEDRRGKRSFKERRDTWDTSTAARIDEIVDRFKAALAELQEQHREERARDAAEIADLHATLARYRKAIETAAKHAYRVELERAGEAEAKLASGAGEGEVAL